MLQRFLKFFKANSGADLAEYCLLLAFIALIALGVLIKVNGGIGSIWASANNTTAAGATAATTPASPGNTTASTPAGN